MKNDPVIKIKSLLLMNQVLSSVLAVDDLVFKDIDRPDAVLAGKVLKTYKAKTDQNRDKSEKLEQIDNTYNEKGLLIGKKWSAGDNILKREEYSWFVNGTLNRKSTYIEDDRLIEYLSHKYIQRVTTLGDAGMFDLTRELAGE